MSSGKRNGHGRGRGNKSTGNKWKHDNVQKHKSSGFDVNETLEEAKVLHQRAERRKGDAAIQAVAESVLKYRQVLERGQLSETNKLEANSGLGTALHLWADTIQQVCSSAPDSNQSAAFEAEAKARSVALYREAVSSYSQVINSDNSLRADAAVNIGNALVAASELVADVTERHSLLVESLSAFEVALKASEEAETHSSMADALLKLGEACLRLGRPEEGERHFRRSLEAYQAACGLSDSANGDDLPGLLYDWGVSCYTIAGHATDDASAYGLLQQAMAKLKDSSSFDRGDPQPLNAAGDVCVAVAERRLAQGDREGAMAALDEALDEGFRQALHLRRNDADALVGSAEVLVLKGRIARDAGDAGAGSRLFQEAARAYGSALYDPSALGSFSERCDVRYNYAYALCCAGQEEEAARQLASLVQARGREFLEELSSDEDFAPYRSRPWFAALGRP